MDLRVRTMNRRAGGRGRPSDGINFAWAVEKAEITSIGSSDHILDADRITETTLSIPG